MTVITISHQRGSGGRAIGQAVARELSLSYVDREIVRQVASILNLPEERAALRDEHAEGIVGRIMFALAEVPAVVFGAPPPDHNLGVEELACQRTTQSVIEAAARSNLVVIAGHGANFALAGHRGVFNVFIYAPFEQRARRVMEREGVERAEAARLVARSDHERAHYIRHFYRADWQAPEHYHLMVNTGVLTEEQAAGLIVASWRGGRFGPFR